LFAKINEKFDLITSNPPYLTKGEYVSENVNFEPKTALYAENNGFAVIKKILLDFLIYNHLTIQAT